MEDLMEYYKGLFARRTMVEPAPRDRHFKKDFAWTPETSEEFEATLYNAPLDILKGFGFLRFETVPDYFADASRNEQQHRMLPPPQQLLLFPVEWYTVIPEGFEVVMVSGEVRPFYKADITAETRMGCLAFGILLDKIKKDAV